MPAAAIRPDRPETFAWLWDALPCAWRARLCVRLKGMPPWPQRASPPNCGRSRRLLRGHHHTYRAIASGVAGTGRLLDRARGWGPPSWNALPDSCGARPCDFAAALLRASMAPRSKCLARSSKSCGAAAATNRRATARRSFLPGVTRAGLSVVASFITLASNLLIWPTSTTSSRSNPTGGVGSGRFTATVSQWPFDCGAAIIRPKVPPRGPDREPFGSSFEPLNASKMLSEAQSVPE
jgi:hypothetical protein